MITVLGVNGLVPAAPVETADVFVASERLMALAPPGARRVVLAGELRPVLDAIAAEVAGGASVCVAASGDPGWFGILRALADRFGRTALRVVPAPSSVSSAFARLAMPWDDAVVVSAHGRPLADAARIAARSPKVAVLTSPDAPPSALGQCLLSLGATHQHVAVCSALGLPDESVSVTTLGSLATGEWDPLSVVVLWSGSGISASKSLAWGLPEDRYVHRDGMITKAEVRAAAIGLLALPAAQSPAPVLWDVGAGSGSVVIECVRLAPWLEAFAVEHDASAAEACHANAATHGVAVSVVASCAGLPPPDRVFVGGGGLDVLEMAWDRLRSGGILVATHAALDRAATAASTLGNLTSVVANRGRQLPDGGWRLEGTNPVFITWGAKP